MDFLDMPTAPSRGRRETVLGPDEIGSAHMGLPKRAHGTSLEPEMKVSRSDSSDSGTAGKVGRKRVEQNEPETKRRAQNRQAQRAFRERKEKHLKELENRVAELEQESRAWQSTSVSLRHKLSALEDELSHYRSGKNAPDGSQQRQQPHVPGGFNFSYPPEIPLTPGSDRGDTKDANLMGFPGNSVSRMPGAGNDVSPTMFNAFVGESPFSAARAGYQGAGNVSTGHTPTSNSSTRSSGSGSTSPHAPSLGDVPGLARAPTPDSEEFCDQLALACPIWSDKNKKQGAAEATKAATGQRGTGHAVDRTDVFQQTLMDPSFGLGFDYRDSVPFDEEPPELPELITSEYGTFDPLEDILNWPDESDLAGSGTATATATATVPPAPVLEKEEEVPANKSKFMSCLEVWDRISAHPRFGEIDINNMCAELRAKAKCSDSGVVLPETHLETVLKTYQ